MVRKLISALLLFLFMMDLLGLCGFVFPCLPLEPLVVRLALLGLFPQFLFHRVLLLTDNSLLYF